MALFKKIIYLMLKIILFCGSAKKLLYHKFRHNHFGKFTDIFIALVKLIELLNAFVVFKIFLISCLQLVFLFLGLRALIMNF